MPPVYERKDPALDALGQVAAARKQPGRAVRLFAASESLRETIGAARSPGETEEIERDLLTARQALGEAAFSEAQQAGRAMSLEQALAYALEEAGASSQGSVTSTPR
ncbi:MAG TPA: hypothetical protein VKU00_33745 [Chthonomonadaceae bacterium]|nr:hypothetical protein [Chthonomonadaceae bacterium]